MQNFNACLLRPCSWLAWQWTSVEVVCLAFRTFYVSRGALMLEGA